MRIKQVRNANNFRIFLSRDELVQICMRFYSGCLWAAVKIPGSRSPVCGIWIRGWALGLGGAGQGDRVLQTMKPLWGRKGTEVSCQEKYLIAVTSRVPSDFQHEFCSVFASAVLVLHLHFYIHILKVHGRGESVWCFLVFYFSNFLNHSLILSI